jgi:hypothetical protein
MCRHKSDLYLQGDNVYIDGKKVGSLGSSVEGSIAYKKEYKMPSHRKRNKPINFHLDARSNQRTHGVSYGSTVHPDGDLDVTIYFRMDGVVGGCLKVRCGEGSIRDYLRMDILFQEFDKDGSVISSENLSHSIREWRR